MSQFSEIHPTSVGDRAPDFELPGVDDEVHHLTPYCQKYQAIATIFMSNACPVVQGYLERLKHLQNEFQTQNVIFIGINANDADKVPQDSFENMKTFAAQQELNFPYLRDPSQDVARSFGATTTPEVFLLDRGGFIRYRGAIDDNPEFPEKVEHFYLQDAIAAVLQNRDVSPQSTEAIGCALQWRGG